MRRYELVVGSMDIEVTLFERDNHARVYLCDPHHCHSIDLTKKEVADLIMALVEMKEVMND